MGHNGRQVYCEYYLCPTKEDFQQWEAAIQMKMEIDWTLWHLPSFHQKKWSSFLKIPFVTGEAEVKKKKMFLMLNISLMSFRVIANVLSHSFIPTIPTIFYLLTVYSSSFLCLKIIF